jgi:signal transduction histidine kinase
LRITKLKRIQAREAYQKEINNLLQSQELKSVEAMLSGQDKERKRIAQDLHDRLGSILSATKMYFESVLPEKLLSSEKGEKACNLLDQAIDQTRLISYDLTSGVLSKFGFAAALEDLKQTVEGSGSIKMLLNLSNNSQRFTADTEINLYRIVQEAVSNILKHAEATEIKIRLNLSENQYLLSIEDNGKGFDTSVAQTGMGLQNMLARTGKFKGDYSIKSEPGNGTHIHITFNPKTYEEDYYS